MCTDCGPPPSALVTRRSLFDRRTRRMPLVAPVDVAVDLSIYPRSAWAGDDHPPLGDLYPEQVYFLLVHHSAGPNGYDEAGALDEMRGVYRFHTGPDRGWPDVCYNFFIDRFGRVFEARSGSLEGAVMADATGGSQGFAQLVCLLGDFTSEMPSPEMLSALERFLAWKANVHQLDIGPDATATFVSRGSNRWPEGAEVTTNTIAGHRDMSQTACPGDTFYPVVRDSLPINVAAIREAVGAVATVPRASVPPGADSTLPSTPQVATAQTQPPATPPPSVASGETATPTTSTSETESTVTSVVLTGEGQDSNSLLVGGAIGGGVVALAAGITWVIQRRHENGL